MIKKTLKEHQKKEHSPQLRLLLLGAPQLKINETPVRLPYLKAEALLYYLAVTGRPHSRANLAALLWSKSTEHQARNSLRNAIYTIRQGLKPAHVVVVERDTISLNMAGIELDVIYFQTIVKEHPANTAALSAALALWRSAFLDGLHLPDAPVFDEWIAEQRTHYDALYRQGLFYLGQLLAAEKLWLEAQQTIETLLAVDPLHEAGYQQLMRIHMQMGNRAAALNRYETLRTLLVEQLGVDPDPASQALHLELLQADGVPSSKNLMVGLPAKLSRQYKFVGRERELDLLTQYYQNILPSGAARLIMIEGEPGIGKTRLAKEWLATLTRTGILTTRCFEAEQVIPFQPWIDLIRTTLKQIPVPQLGLPDIWLIELAHLVPEIRLQRPDLEPSQITDPELARGRIIQAVYHWLEAMCRYQPLCILIDDWQWLDQASFTLLRYILRPQQSNRLPLLILGTQLEAQPMLGWSKFRTVLEREDILHHIKLRRLSLAELTRLAQSIDLPAAMQTNTFFKRLLTETEGNPLFITEFLQTLTQATLPSGDWPIPPTIQTVIQSRLNQLSRVTYQILAAAAVIGKDFTDTILQQICEFSLETILQALEEAIAANLITEQTGSYDFTHDKIRTVLLDTLTQSRRRHLHLRIAAVLESTLPNDFGLLSHHFEMGGDYLKARDYGLRAACQTVELYADEDALRWYEKIEALPGTIDAELSTEAIPKITPFQHSHLSRTLPLDIPGLIYRQRGLIHQRIGQYDEAERAFQMALKRGTARKRFDEQAAAHNLLSFLAYLRSNYDGVGSHAQKSLDLAAKTGESALRAPGLRHLGISVYRTGDYTRARQLYDESLTAYRQAGDKLGMAAVYNNIGFVLRTQTHYAEAIAAFQEALTIYEAIGQVEGVALICSNIGRTYAFSEDLAQAQQYLERGLALSTESHTDWITVKIHRTMGNVFAQDKQWLLALSHAQQAQSLAAALGSAEDLGATLRLLAEIAAGWPDSNLGNPTTYYEQSMALLEQVGAKDELERTKESYDNYVVQATRLSNIQTS